MDSILANAFGVELANRSFGGLRRIRLAVDFAHACDGVITCEHHGDERCRRHEFFKLRIVGASDMLGVVLLRHARCHLHELHREDLESRLFIDGDDIARMLLLESVRLDEYQSLFLHLHISFYFP